MLVHQMVFHGIFLGYPGNQFRGWKIHRGTDDVPSERHVCLPNGLLL